MKSDTADLGTKNIHSVEAEQINSDFEDYIEMKANIRELQLLNYFDQFYLELNVDNIVITGSTSYDKSKWKSAKFPTKYSIK
ncbi:UNVERIFIED_CONTAM: hypothetical protein O8I53_07440 [Campylobacter lari]